MANKGRRKSVSMRDYEYFALKFYKEHLNEHGSEHNMTSVLRDIAFGELPPIPKKFLDMGRIEAEKARDERAKNPAPPIKESEEKDFRVGGGIFTF